MTIKTTLLLAIIALLSACNPAYKLAYDQTAAMKKYGIEFRLSDFQQRIDYFEKQGLPERAKAEKLKIAEDNRQLVENFRKEFDFCPVRFFYASQSNALLSRKPVLLNDNLEPDPSIPLPEQIIVAYYAPGEISENEFKGVAFRIIGTTAYIRPKYVTWLGGSSLKAKDIAKINATLYKRNKTQSANKEGE